MGYVDNVVCHWQNSASAIQGPHFSCSTCPVWGPTGICPCPILFVLYTAEIGRIVAQHGLKFHQYADDYQIYVATSVSAVHSAIDQLSRCLHNVDVWMSASRLRLNASKAQVL